MSDKVYTRMMLRRRFCKRIIILGLIFTISFYSSILLFGDPKIPTIMKLTNLQRCPACYGVTVCPELYSSEITLETNGWYNIFNTKNIYYGYTKSNRKVVLKQLAHDWEFQNFDLKLCKRWKLKRNCQPKQLLNASNIEEKVIKIIKYNLSWSYDEPRKGLVMCPYAQSFYDLLHSVPDVPRENPKSHMINIWTMLMINPEPLILQIIPKSKGWPVPAYAGVCGRLEVVAHEGESLSALTHIEWHKKLKQAKQMLSAAMDFTYKHDRFRFYLMDWSIDNIVADTDDRITFVDLEDVIVLDKQTSPQKDLPDWYQRYTRENMGTEFTFSIDNICKHHLSDHNIWAACHVLANEQTGYLYPIPKEVNSSKPHFDKLLKECLNGNDRFVTVNKLEQLMGDMLNDEKIIGYGVR
ncbi:hypothetical protein K1T71_012962 [Dendrolimus kikuchii]|uniref:Uncharacterized protein n=1 Tax=Dendrolimus kikuchii TaxID=765133 RepID=A0ACC1CIX6_9NEOP|nr:hypothetical protein K1T71_012962 [Dendrolimus kikuchii]